MKLDLGEKVELEGVLSAGLRISLWDSLEASLGGRLRSNFQFSFRVSLGDTIRDSLEDRPWSRR